MRYRHARSVVTALIAVVLITAVFALYGGATRGSSQRPPATKAPQPTAAPQSGGMATAPAFAPVPGTSKVISTPVVGKARTFDVTFASDAVDDEATALGHHGIRVLLPDDYATSQKRYPVIYLLHGMGSMNYQSWDAVARTTMLRVTAGEDVIVVMLDGGKNGWYTNWIASGAVKQNWEDLHLNQVVPLVDKNLRTVADRSGRAIAGMSMGGYGAMRYAADRPDLFSSVASISGAVNLQDPVITGLGVMITSRVLGFPASGAYGSPVPGKNDAWVKANPVRRAEAYRDLNTYAFVGSGFDGAEPVVRNGFYALRGAMRAAGLHEGFDGPDGRDHYFLDYGIPGAFEEGTCAGFHDGPCNAYALGLAFPMLIASLSGKQAVAPAPPAAPARAPSTGSTARSASRS